MSAIRRARPLLGTFVEITAIHASDGDGEAAVDAAFSAVELVHRLMSFHEPGSDVSRLNHEAFIHPIAIHPWTYKVLKTACEISKKTDGLFDCTVARSLVDLDSLPAPQTPAQDDRDGNYKHIRFLGPDKVSFLKPVWIDFGGIAKGFAVDKAVECLKRDGVRQGCVNAGGDLRVFGGVPQPIHVRRPENPSSFVSMGSFRETAFATSGIYFSKKIIHPKFKRFHADLSSISVMAPECIIADALTKAVALDPERSARCLRKFGARAFILETLS